MSRARRATRFGALAAPTGASIRGAIVGVWQQGQEGLAIVALVVGALGLIAGGGALVLARRGADG